MWVIVSEVIGDSYIGILDSKPATVEPEDDVYLVFGAEIPFKSEHIAGIRRLFSVVSAPLPSSRS